MVNTGARAIHVVQGNTPKRLRGLSHQGPVAGHRDCPLPCHGHAMLPAQSAHLTHSCQPGGTWEARTAPFASRGGEPQGRPMALRVWGWEQAKAVLS